MNARRNADRAAVGWLRMALAAGTERLPAASPSDIAAMDRALAALVAAATGTMAELDGVDWTAVARVAGAAREARLPADRPASYALRRLARERGGT